MKNARFLFTIIGLAALTPGVGFAGEPASQPSEQNSQESHATTVRPADRMRGNGDPSDRTQSKVNDPVRASEKISGPVSLTGQIKRAPANQLPRPVLKKAATAAKDGLTIHKTTNPRELAAKPPVGSGATAPTTILVRGRSAATAIIGGAAAASAKNSAAVVNGADIKRKP
jgi:hypothetical protein